MSACSRTNSPKPAPAPAAESEGNAAPVLTEFRPDVLVLVVDSLRVDRMNDLRRRESDREVTPNLDGISRSGITTFMGLAPSPHTAPSLASLFTGVAPAAHGIRNVEDDQVYVLSDQLATLAELMRDAGFTTTFVHESGQVQPNSGLTRGFDVVIPTGGLSGSIASIDSVLGNAPAERPQFVVLHTYEAHAPFLPPRDHFGLKFRGRYTEAEGTDPDRGGQFRERQEALEAFEGNRRGREFADLAGGFLEPYEGMSEADVEWLNDLYDENLAWVDAQIGDLVATWSRHRSYGDTIVALTAGHGIALGENGQIGNERGLFGALTHVPYVLSGPGVAPGYISSTASIISIPGTLLELVDVEAPRRMAASLGNALTRRGTRAVEDEAAMQSLATDEYGYSLMRYVVTSHGTDDARYFDPMQDTSLLVDADLDENTRALLLTAHQRRIEQDRERGKALGASRAPLAQRARQRLRVLGYLR